MTSPPDHVEWNDEPAPSWGRGHDVPHYLALREGRVPIVVVAPHGGRRLRAIRRGDSVNDLHTADIAWELARRLDAHAIVNHSLDRNDIDLNRISHLAERAPGVLALLSSSIEAASSGGEVPLVLFVHGWNMVVPCCDVGVGLRRREGRLVGRFPTMSRRRYDETIAAIEHSLEVRGVRAAIGMRYPASGRDNAAQLFSGRHAEHADETVAALSRLAIAGRVDAAQLELGIALRWPGAGREAFLDALTEALAGGGWSAPMSLRRSGSDAGDASSISSSGHRAGPRVPLTLHAAQDPDGIPRAACGWTLDPAIKDTESHEHDPGFAMQAVIDSEGGLATFCGVESTGPRSMAARFSVVCADGTMFLLVGEGAWSGDPGRYDLEGFSWRSSTDLARIDLHLEAMVVRYRTHEAYLDLEEGLAGSELTKASVQLVYEAATPEHGRLHGRVRVGDLDLDVDTTAFVDHGARRRGQAEGRLRVLAVRGESARGNSVGEEVSIVRSGLGADAVLTLEPQAGGLGVIRPAGEVADSSGLREARVVARVPVWRPVGDGAFARWSFGIVRCRFEGDEGEGVAGLFDSLEVFRRPR